MQKPKDAVPKARGRWRIVVNALLLAASLGTALLVAEFALRAFFPQRLYFNVSRWDPYVGFSPIPGAKGFSVHEDFMMRVQINSHGLRDREFAYAKPRDTLRIGVFGDSFTFGEGVQNDEPYPKALERLLSRDATLQRRYRGIEVLNFGIGKTGTSHQLAWYRKEGRKYDLDGVIVGFLGSNDFGDNRAGVFDLRDGQLVHKPQAYSSVRRIQAVVYRIPFYQWLASHSHLVNLIRQGATTLDDRLRVRRNVKVSPVSDQVRPEFSASTRELTMNLMESFRNEVARDGGWFLVVNIPAKHQHPMIVSSGGNPEPLFVAPTEELMANLTRQGFDVLDLVPVFANLPPADYYFAHDGHWNPAGHEAAAAEIYRHVTPSLLAPPRHATQGS